MAALSTSYDVESGVKTTLKTGITASQTTGIILKRALNITAGVLLINRASSTQEWISFNSITVAGSETTLGDVVRGLATSGNTFVGSSTRAYAHSSAESVELVDYHILLNLKANIDRANTWSADQLFSGSTKLLFNDANNYIQYSGGDLIFKSSSQAAVALSTLASGGGSTNDKIKVTINDTTNAYLDNKVVPGSGLIRTINNPGANETYQLDVNLEASNPSLQISSDELGLKIKSAGGLAKDSNGVYVDTSVLSGVPATDIVSSRLYGESITANDILYLNGDTYAKKAQSDVLKDCFSFIGVAKQSGVLNDTKNVAMIGTVATINSISASLNDAKKFDGQTQQSSSTNVSVYGVNWYAQTFTPATGQTNVSEAVLNLTKNSTPAGTYTLEVRATAAGLPTGAALGTATLGVASMATGDNTFVFASPVAVTPGTVYALVLYNAGADVTNHYAWNYATTNPYSGGQWCTSVNSGGSWAANASNDFRFLIKYKGIPSTDLFLSDIVGSPDINPGTYFKRIGRLLSATQATLFESSPSIFATYTYTSLNVTVDTEITLGFRARAVLAWNETSNGFWHYGMSTAQQVAHWTANDTGGGTTVEPYGGLQTSALAYHAFNRTTPTPSSVLTVQAVTADTITIRRVVTGSVSETVYLLILG